MFEKMLFGIGVTLIMFKYEREFGYSGLDFVSLRYKRILKLCLVGNMRNFVKNYNMGDI